MKRVLSVVLLLSTASLRAQAPYPLLSAIDPPAGTPGTPIRVRLEGKRLDGAKELLFDHPGIRAVRVEPLPEPAVEDQSPREGKKGGRKQRQEGEKKPEGPLFDVTVAAGVPSGLYDARASSDLGLSAPRAFHVGAVPLLADLDPKKGEPVALDREARVAGWIDEGLADRFLFRAPRSGTIVVECYAERIDSRLDATLEVKDARGRSLVFSRDRIGLDPALAFKSQAGEEYEIVVWDFTYGGRYPYLLSVSAEPRVLFAFPPAAFSSSATRAQLYGWNLPGGTRVDGRDLEAAPGDLRLAACESGVSSGLYRSTRWLTRALRAARVSDFVGEPVVALDRTESASPAIEVETEPNDAWSTPGPLGSAIAGRFDRLGDRDWYRFAAKKGKRLTIEVFSSRFGTACDPQLFVAQPPSASEKDANTSGDKKKPSGPRELVSGAGRKSDYPREEAFERKFVPPDRDPYVLFAPPEDGEYLLSVRDANGQSGPEAFYVVVVRPTRPDFDLVVTHTENSSGEALTLERGSVASCDVLVDRRESLQETIRVRAEDLPAGVTAPEILLGPKESYAPLVFRAAPDAAAWSGRVRVVGETVPAGEGQDPLRREALSAVMVFGGTENRHPLDFFHSRLTSGLALSVREREAPFQVEIQPATREALPGDKLAVKVRAVRAKGFTGEIQVALYGLGERALPDGEGKRPANLTLSKDQSEGEVSLSLKNDLGFGERTLVAFATASVEYSEPPSEPKKDSKPKVEKRRTTLASTPVRVRLVSPVEIALVSRSGRVPPGGSAGLRFDVRRRPGFDGDVEASLQLPAQGSGFSADTVRLKKGDTVGALVLKCDPKAASARIDGASLRVRVNHAGRGFDESVPLPFALEAGAFFEVVGVEAARVGAVRLTVRPRAQLEGSAVALDVRIAGTGSDEARAATTLERDRGLAAACVDLAPIGGGLRDPLRVRIKAALDSGEVIEDHVVQLPARGTVPGVGASPNVAKPAAVNKRTKSKRL